MPRLPIAQFARQNRNAPTSAEKTLWAELRKLKPQYKFSRQIRIGNFIVDFCCRQYRLVVEVDGESHSRKIEEDEARDAFLRESGYEVVRIANEQLFLKPDQVVQEVVDALERRPRYRY